MPTATYSHTAFSLLESGLACIKLDLSSGNNTFDLTLINCPATDDPSEWCHGEQANTDPLKQWCCILPKEIRDKIREKLCPIVIPIPTFNVPGGKVRLNHLAKSNAILDWQAARGGSILLTVQFESAGTEILGTYHGQINDGELYIYLAVSVDHCTGKLLVTPFTSFGAHIDIDGVPDFVERGSGLRGMIREKIAQAAKEALQSAAHDLAELIIGSLYEAGQPTAPGGAFFYQVKIADGHATLSWADSVRHADIAIESVEPDLAADDERLILRVNAWAVSDFGQMRSRTAQPGDQLALPLKVACVSLPDGNPLHLSIGMDAIALSGSHQQGRPVGKVTRTFASPGYGSGSHTGSDGDLTVTYGITVT